ncbi:MAG TPA: hypothetical protein IAB45_03495 [Candidatus Onthousia faecavium]|nr:hypothetical protein [Candidatus Onthousia faecavium]
MKVIAIIKFNDLESNKIREVNDVFDVSKERAKVLLEKKYVKEVVETATLDNDVEKATIKSTKVKKNAKK